jgi:hypothetical protein
VTDKIIYYAIIDKRTTPEKPAGLARRVRTASGGLRDEALNRSLEWQLNPMIASWERAESSDDLVEVSAEEAERLIEYFRDMFGSDS